MTSDYHECFTYQLEPLNEQLAKGNFFEGSVYSARWITDSIKEKRLLDKDNYFRYENSGEGVKRMEFGRTKVIYTMTEGIKVLEIGFANKTSSRGAHFWQGIEREGIVPKRSSESMRNFFKTHMVKGVEEYIKHCLENGTRFCHAFSNIPRVKGYANVSFEQE
jgi:hypothetical protein